MGNFKRVLSELTDKNYGVKLILQGMLLGLKKYGVKHVDGDYVKPSAKQLTPQAEKMFLAVAEDFYRTYGMSVFYDMADSKKATLDIGADLYNQVFLGNRQIFYSGAYRNLLTQAGESVGDAISGYVGPMRRRELTAFGYNGNYVVNVI